MRVYVLSDIFSEPDEIWPFWRSIGGGLPVTRLALNALSGRADLTGEALHRHLFQAGGMDQAQRALQQRLTAHSIGVGFSAGGTALWQAALRRAPLLALFCVSSTRLRDLPALPITNHVYFGADDPGLPAREWLATIPEQATVIAARGHDFYRHPSDLAAQRVRDELSTAIAACTAACPARGEKAPPPAPDH